MPLSFIDLLSADLTTIQAATLLVSPSMDSRQYRGSGAIKKPLTQSDANGLWESMTATDGSGITSALGEKNTLGAIAL